MNKTLNNGTGPRTPAGTCRGEGRREGHRGDEAASPSAVDDAEGVETRAEARASAGDGHEVIPSCEATLAGWGEAMVSAPVPAGVVSPSPGRGEGKGSPASARWRFEGSTVRATTTAVASRRPDRARPRE
ncbi:hypothetical protein GCM10017600_86060 [Streptosporangium carneum]|uniref:Uncharacterized protein n=1 Tax=Streptosporangium carneum TaxID=47481 RepID=A0A9W6MIP2_9ACTN|nr:hypothetical protein GCM10017600_86060 [Streptosporangium carneum]